MKKTILIFIIILASALIVVPFFLASETTQLISVGSNLVSSLASLITLIIAVQLYSKYGVEKSLVQKQTDVVFLLLGEIKKTRFLFQWGKGNMLQLFLNDLKNDYWKDYKDKEIIFSFGYAEGLNLIWELSENIFLPKAIASKINPLKISMITHLTKEETEYQMKLIVPGYHKEEEQQNFGVLNNKIIKLGDYVNLWASVIESINIWLQKNCDSSISINFEREQ
ncbi:MAG: hypothetical protein KBC69_01085 [Candidatus Magasanikbacteria bacterium]|nr:hypothetical protein [Candidatus Magasanikbacteria bacterium]